VSTQHKSLDSCSRILQHISLDSHSRMLLDSGLFFSQNFLELLSCRNFFDSHVKCGCDEDIVPSGISTIIVFRLSAITSPIKLRHLRVETPVVACKLLSPASSFRHFLVFKSNISVSKYPAVRSNWYVTCLSKVFFQHLSGLSV